MRFEWDKRKASSNIEKHGVSFSEAATVFYDSYARIIDDPEHSESEERFVILGLSKKGACAHRLPLLSGKRGSDQDHLCSQSDKNRIGRLLEVLP